MTNSQPGEAGLSFNEAPTRQRHYSKNTVDNVVCINREHIWLYTFVVVDFFATADIFARY